MNPEEQRLRIELEHLRGRVRVAKRISADRALRAALSAMIDKRTERLRQIAEQDDKARGLRV